MRGIKGVLYGFGVLATLGLAGSGYVMYQSGFPQPASTGLILVNVMVWLYMALGVNMYRRQKNV